MTVGILRLSLFIAESHSLKEKRMVLHSIKARVRNNFNVAVSAIDDEDKWQKATLAIASVERSRSSANSVLSQVVDFLNRDHRVSLMDYELELL